MARLSVRPNGYGWAAWLTRVAICVGVGGLYAYFWNVVGAPMWAWLIIWLMVSTFMAWLITPTPNVPPWLGWQLRRRRRHRGQYVEIRAGSITASQLSADLIVGNVITSEVTRSGRIEK